MISVPPTSTRLLRVTMVQTPFSAFVVIGSLLLSSVATAAEDVLARNNDIRYSAADWPCWRGARGDGIAPSDQSPPGRWSRAENVIWKALIAGRCHSSPIVVG